MIFCEASVEHREREKRKARELRESHWWKGVLAKRVCYYCGVHVSMNELTMDHKIPISRGGKSTRGNVVPSCRSCNQKKSYKTTVDLWFENIEGEQ